MPSIPGLGGHGMDDMGLGRYGMGHHGMNRRRGGRRKHHRNHLDDSPAMRYPDIDREEGEENDHDDEDDEDQVPRHHGFDHDDFLDAFRSKGRRMPDEEQPESETKPTDNSPDQNQNQNQNQVTTESNTMEVTLEPDNGFDDYYDEEGKQWRHSSSTN